jgi:hypothetical protein
MAAEFSSLGMWKYCSRHTGSQGLLPVKQVFALSLGCQQGSFLVMVESLVAVAVTGLLTMFGWFGSKAVSAGVRGIRESTEFRIEMNIGLETIAKELSQFRADINQALAEERAQRTIERQEYKLTHESFDDRIGYSEQQIARHDERITNIERRVLDQEHLRPDHVDVFKS